jgi:hypothetical protein
MKAYIVDSTRDAITIQVVSSGTTEHSKGQRVEATKNQQQDHRREKQDRRERGYKGHRAGTMKEKLHQIFDKYGGKDLEKAKAEAVKKTKAAPATINTSFSRFRALA